VSHISKVQIVVSDLDVLAVACEDCGVELDRTRRKFRAYGGKMESCEAAIVLPGSHGFEVGVYRCRVTEDGRVIEDAEGDRWSLKFDNWPYGNDILSHVGKDCGTLLQRYGRHQAVATAETLGWAVASEETADDGTVALTFDAAPQYAVQGQCGAAAGSWQGGVGW
jgi:hypothetical protein